MIYWLFTGGQRVLGIALLPSLVLAVITPVVYCWTAGAGIQRTQQRPTPGSWSGWSGVLRAGTVVFPTLAAVIVLTHFGHDVAIGSAQGRPATTNLLTQVVLGTPSTLSQGKLLSACLLGGLILVVLNLVLQQAIQNGGALRELIDRSRRPDLKRGELGSAHLCTAREFQRFRVEARDPKERGVPVLGAFYGDKRLRLDGGQGKLHRSAEDMARGWLVIGRPGTGKTQGHILPAIADAMDMGHSLIVTDPQDELTRHILDYARCTGHLVVIHDPTSPTCARYNLNDKIADVTQARTIAMVLVPPASGDNAYFSNSATDLLAACLIKFPSLGEIKMALSNLDKLKQMFAAVNDDAAVLAGGFISGLTGDGRTAASIVSTLQTALSAWASADVRASTGASDFGAEVLAKQATVIILKCPNESSTAYGPYLGAVLSKLILNLDTIAQRNLTPGEIGRLPIPVALILEEFYALGYLEIIIKKINLVRKRRIGIVMAIQTIGQLYETYGKDGTNTLLAGCAFQTVYGMCDHETAEFYSKVSGTATVGTPNADPSRSNYRQRPLLTPDELATPFMGVSTMFIAYSDGAFAGQVILYAQPTFMYQRTDWAARIKAGGSGRPFQLQRGSTFKPKTPAVAPIPPSPAPASSTTAPQTTPRLGPAQRPASSTLPGNFSYLPTLAALRQPPVRTNRQIGE